MVVFSRIPIVFLVLLSFPTSAWTQNQNQNQNQKNKQTTNPQPVYRAPSNQNQPPAQTQQPVYRPPQQTPVNHPPAQTQHPVYRPPTPPPQPSYRPAQQFPVYPSTPTQRPQFSTQQQPPLRPTRVVNMGSTQAFVGPNHEVRSIQTPAIRINRGVQGTRRFESDLPDGVRLVGMGAHHGYVEQPLRRNGRGYVQRTYVVNQRTYTRVYSTYSYHGVVVEGYVVPVYYSPRFYQWCYYPWPRPVPFAWGWSLEPWYGYYGAYFTATPFYDSPSLWLTDYLLAANLELAYQEMAEAKSRGAIDHSPGGEESTNRITPELKQQLAAQVREQLADENYAASNPSGAPSLGQSPAPLDAKERYYVVSMDLDVAIDGQPCSLTPGDILQLNSPLTDGDQAGVLQVVASKPMDCIAGSQVMVSIADMQNMHNSFVAHVDNGLARLASSQGRRGMPASPEAEPHPVPEGQPGPSNSNAVALLEQQRAVADQTEQHVIQEVESKPDNP